MNIERWRSLLHRLNATADDKTFFRLQSAYAEKHRAYHTGRHIEECLSLLDEMEQLAQRPAEVELALWFHDAIYETTSKSNEERRAEWAPDFGGNLGMPMEAISRVHAHIIATCHVSLPTDDDSRLVIDIDLAILGAKKQRYDEFERDVRKEYRWVPEIIYRPKRAEILHSFLDRARIYHWEPMYQRYELAARANLNQAISTLRLGT